MVLLNTTTGEEYCTGAFEGYASINAPDWDCVSCAFTGILKDGEEIEVRATSTYGATLDPDEVDDNGLRIGVGATFNVLQYALPKPKKSYRPKPKYHPYHGHGQDHYGYDEHKYYEPGYATPDATDGDM